ncbi:single insulin-like growth factor-binding domain protein-2 [Macrobrachium rosenbergii]|uniref:single insulin-like growth factor-binding domain protein-2 n=1 Tax=Macrobrachium rosenbergii TaxID=79674 RepID=UPI0034D4494A
MASHFTLLLCISLAMVTVSGLTCRPCETVKCASPESLDCPFGAVERQCGCCYECRKGKGEECGGSYNIFGTCSEELICDGGHGWQRPGYCKTQQQLESDRTSSTSGTSTTSGPLWLG